MNIIEAVQKMEQGEIVTLPFIREGSGFAIIQGDICRVGLVDITPLTEFNVDIPNPVKIKKMDFYIIKKDFSFRYELLISIGWILFDYKKHQKKL